MTPCEIRDALQEAIAARVGSTVMVSADVAMECLRRLDRSTGGTQGVPTGATARVREYLAASPGATAKAATRDLGFSAYRLMHRLFEGGYARREEVAPGIFGYWLTDKVNPKTLPPKRTPEEIHRANAESKRRYRERIRAERIAGGAVLANRSRYATEEERQAAAKASRDRYEAKRKAEREAVRAASQATMPKPPRPKRERGAAPKPAKPARSLEARIAKQIKPEARSGVRVDLAVKPVLPDSSAFMAQNPHLVEVLPVGAISQPKPTLTSREKRLINGDTFATRKRA